MNEAGTGAVGSPPSTTGRARRTPASADTGRRWPRLGRVRLRLSPDPLADRRWPGPGPGRRAGCARPRAGQAPPAPGDGRLRRPDDPCRLVRPPRHRGRRGHLPVHADAPQVEGAEGGTLPSDRRHLLDHFSLADVADKVVGVGSVGTRAWIFLLEGGVEDEVLLLQAKQAQASALAGHAGPSEDANQGQRVVTGQRRMQATSDIFLGWLRVESPRWWRRGLRPAPAPGLEAVGRDR